MAGNGTIARGVSYGEENISSNLQSLTGWLENGSTNSSQRLSMQASIYNGLFNDNAIIPTLQPICTTGHCVWPTYTTLAVCASVADVTSSLTGTAGCAQGGPEECLPTLPGRAYLRNTKSPPSALLDVSSLTPSIMGLAPSVLASLRDNSIAFKDIQLPIANFFVIYQNKTTASNEITFAAAEGILEWCLQTYTSTVDQGLLFTDLVNSTTDFNITSDGLLMQDQNGQKYEVGSTYHNQVSQFAYSLFNGSVYQSSDNEHIFPAQSDSALAIYTSLQPASSHGISGLQALLGNVATSMTNKYVALRESQMIGC
jgi:hypothetical protein